MSDTQAKATALKALREFRAALDSGGNTADIEMEFYNAVGAIQDNELSASLENAMMAANDEDSERLANAYAEIAGQFKSVQEGISLGTLVAENGKKGLFFPSAAAYLGQVEGIVNEVADAVEKVRAGVDEIKTGVASAEDAIGAENVEGLIDAGEKIKLTIEDLIGTFVELKQDLTP